MRTKGRNKCEERNSLSNTTSKNETKLQLHLTATNKKQQKRIHAKFETNLISQWISKTLIGCTLASVSVVHNSIDKKLSQGLTPSEQVLTWKANWHGYSDQYWV